jgi:hypothetical protein
VLTGLLPLAVVVAVSPVPIVAVVLMLLAPRAGGTGAGFLVGWIAGIGGVTTAVLLLVGDDSTDSDRWASVASYVELGLGVLLLALAVRQWWSRPKDGEETVLPAWLAGIDRLTVARAGGLGLLLSAANPKALLVCIAAGLAIAAGALPAVDSAWSVGVFTAVAASSVAVLVLAHAVGGVRIARPLRSLRGWLTAHSAAATASLLGVIGVVLVVQGAGGLL